MKGFWQSIKDRLWRAFKSPKRSGKASGLLLIAAGGLGDVIMLRYVLERFVKLAGPGENVVLLVNKGAVKMAFLMPGNVEILAVDFEKFRKNSRYRYQLMKDICLRHFREVISLDFLRHPLLDEAIMLAAKAEQTRAMKARPWDKYQKLLDKNEKAFDRVYLSGPVHSDKILRLAGFADALSGEKQPLPVLKLPESALKPALSKTGPLYIFQPFSAVKAKQVGVEIYQRLLNLLPEDADILITGAPDDPEKNPEFKVLLDHAGVRFEDALFEDLVAYLRAADLVVSVDTAVMHLSAGVGAPTLCLASAAYVGEIVPYSEKISPDNLTVLYHPMPDCQGCLGNCILPEENGRYPCVNRLKMADIEMAFENWLQP